MSFIQRLINAALRNTLMIINISRALDIFFTSFDCSVADINEYPTHSGFLEMTYLYLIHVEQLLVYNGQWCIFEQGAWLTRVCHV